MTNSVNSSSSTIETAQKAYIALMTTYEQAQEEMIQKVLREMPKSAKALLRKKHSKKIAVNFGKEIANFVNALSLPQERALFSEYLVQEIFAPSWTEEEIDAWGTGSSTAPLLFDFFTRLGKKHFFLPSTDVFSKRCVMIVSECAYNFGVSVDHIRKVLNLSPTDEAFDPNLICAFSTEGVLIRRGLWADVFKPYEELAVEQTAAYTSERKVWVRADLLAEFILTSIGRQTPTTRDSAQTAPSGVTLC